MTGEPELCRQHVSTKPPIFWNAQAITLCRQLNSPWWNARENKIERTRIDAVSIHVADNPALRAAVPAESSTVWKGRDFIDAIRDHWLLTIFTLGILTVIAWFIPAAIRSIRQHIARRRTAYLASESVVVRATGCSEQWRRPRQSLFRLAGLAAAVRTARPGSQSRYPEESSQGSEP